ncbi:MAG: DUF192 domain-containing protein [Deltaproteobacteria bacterium]|nr:DUF192 domain-containing protein [Deltaproteobacteria bacterium]
MGLLACRSSPRVIISTKSGKELVLKVEIADTPEKRVLGLQYRSELSDDQGMLFLFPSESVQSFWMKNTPLSLDMIFIGGDLKIVGIIHQAIPFSTASQFAFALKGYRSKGLGDKRLGAVGKPFIPFIGANN